MADKEKIKVLLYSDCPAVHTGFAKVAREVVLRLIETGRYDITSLGINFYGHPCDLHGIDNLHLYPVSGDDMQGAKVLKSLLVGVNPDVFFTINDYDALNFVPRILQEVNVELNKEIPWVWYFPVDGEPFDKKYVELLKKMVKFPVTYTKYGQDIIHKADPTLDVPIIYHGVDTSQFKKINDASRKKIREDLALGSDNFVILGIGVNQLRKQYDKLFQAFKEFKKDKDDVILYLHTQPVTRYGWNLPDLAVMMGIQKEVFYTENLSGPLGLHPSQMNFIYNACDIAVFPHCGEGFGLCQAEAMAAELPVVSHGITATPEVVQDGGILLPTQQVRKPGTKDEMHDFKMRFPFGDRGLNRPIVDVAALVDVLEDLYQNRDKLKELGKKGRETILKTPEFHWDMVAMKFDSILTEANESSSVMSLELDEVI